MSDTFVVEAGKKVQDVNVKQTSDLYITKLDDVSTASVTYVGKAEVGSSAASAVWQIMKMDESGTPATLVTTYAGGGSFNQIWNNRTSLSYS